MKHPDMSSTRLHRGALRLLPVLGMLAAQPLFADEVSDAYVMSVIQDSAQGFRLTEGQYSEAVERITAKGALDKGTFAEQNNLCVAYTMLRKFDDATLACDEALDTRASVRYPARWYNSVMTRTRVRDKAMAFSNRGVLRAVNGNAAGARDDFAKAVALKADIDAADSNLARLEVKTVQAVAARQK